MSAYLLSREDVVRACDELHSRMDDGPGTNTAALADSLNTVKRLQAAASWDYPLTLLAGIEAKLPLWFSDQPDAADSRQSLLADLCKLEDAWERPRA
jgi:hypothetical protein